MTTGEDGISGNKRELIAAAETLDQASEKESQSHTAASVASTELQGISETIIDRDEGIVAILEKVAEDLKAATDGLARAAELHDQIKARAGEVATKTIALMEPTESASIVITTEANTVNQLVSSSQYAELLGRAGEAAVSAATDASVHTLTAATANNDLRGAAVDPGEPLSYAARLLGDSAQELQRTLSAFDTLAARIETATNATDQAASSTLGANTATNAYTAEIRKVSGST